MKKFYSGLIGSLLSVVMMTSGAWAAGAITITSDGVAANKATFKIAKEAYKATASVAGSFFTTGLGLAGDDLAGLVIDDSYAATPATNPRVAYTSQTVNPSVIEFGLTGAQFAGASAGNQYFLAVVLDPSPTTPASKALALACNPTTGNFLAGTVVGGALRFGDGSFGIKAAYWDLTGGAASGAQNIPANTKCYIVQGLTALNGAAPLVGSAIANSLVNISINDGHAFTDTLIISVKENNNAANVVTATFAEFANQFSASVTTAFAGTVDVGAARKKFIAAGTTDFVTTTIVNTNATKGYYLNTVTLGTEVTKFTATLTGSSAAISTVIATGTSTVINPTTALPYTSGGWSVDTGSTAIGTLTFTATVNTTDVIDVRSFAIDLVSVPGTGYTAQTYLSKTSAGAWTINAYQATTPYMYAGDAVNDTFIKLFNSSTTNAQVFVDVTLDNGTKYTGLQLNSTNCVGLSATGVDASNVGIIWAKEIAAAAGFPVANSFAATFTVTVGKGNVTGVCFYKRAGGDRQMPLYTTTINAGAADGTMIQ